MKCLVQPPTQRAHRGEHLSPGCCSSLFTYHLSPRSQFASGRTRRGEPPFHPLVLRKGLVCETIQPIFSRLSRGNHWMCRRPSVLTGVSIRRRIAAQRHAACLARAQVNPVRSDLNALLTLMILRMLHRLNRADVDAALTIHNRLSFVQVRRIGQVLSKQNLWRSVISCGERLPEQDTGPGFWMVHTFSPN